MIKLVAKVQAYLANREGATAIEYGLIAGGISLAIIAIVFTFGDQLESIFTDMSDQFTANGIGGEGGGADE